MKKSKINFFDYKPIIKTTAENWHDWKWQIKNSLKSENDFSQYFQLSKKELNGFHISKNKFKIQTTPYYASLAQADIPSDPIRLTFMPNEAEGNDGLQQQLDPLGEKKNNPTPRIIHRYPDRALFLVTDTCSLYCRYCTRKHFTATDQASVNKHDYNEALNYLKKTSSIKEVILSGGDPLTLSNAKLEKIIHDLYQIPSIEIIRIGSRIPATLPMRIDNELINIFKKYKPIYFMSHFNHPNEITSYAAEKLELLVDNGVPVFNQMVLLNGVNNHPAIIYALSRRLLYLRVKPYYMFQCDPSRGSDHFRTPVEESQNIQKELWGKASGLAMPNLCLDIPSGGGKAGFTPNFITKIEGNNYHFKGWDGVTEVYKSPTNESSKTPIMYKNYSLEWMKIKFKNKIYHQSSID